MPLASKDQTLMSRPSLLTRRKHLTVPGEEKKHPNCALDPKDRTSKSKMKTFKSKNLPLKTEIKSEDFMLVLLQQMLKIVPKFFEKQYKIYLFTFFVIKNFGTLGGMISTSHLFIRK